MTEPTVDGPAQPDQPAVLELDDATAALRAAVEEIEAHVAESGWDQPSRLYALARTRDLVVREPALADALGLAGQEPDEDDLTPVEQEHVPVDRTLEEVLEAIAWPAEVHGCAAVVERLVLPPAADDEIPEDDDAAEEYAASHPDRQDVRIVAGVTRDGERWCALRLRAHDEGLAVVSGPDIVPALLDLLHTTLVD
ncbi:MAG: PPA1309 family protein [Nocardioides sp.]|nr:PPA1309 family protein [Nocardioides sp.]